MMRQLLRVLALLVLLTPHVAGARPDDTTTIERYYSIELDSQKVGWGLERTTTDEHARIFTRSEMHFSIARGPITLDLSVDTDFAEEADGSPMAMSMSTRQGGQVTQEHYFWREEGHVDHTTDTDGRQRTEKLKAPTTPWLTPSKVDALVQRKMEAGAKTIAYATLDPSNGLKPVLTKVEIVGKKQIEIMGEMVTATEWRTTTSATPGIIMTSYVDDQGEALLTELPLGGIRLTMRAASKTEALTAFTAPELMVSTLCKPDRAIPNARFAQRAAYRLEGIDGPLPDLPFTGAQQVERTADDALHVSIDVDAKTPAEVTAEERAAYLAGSALADKDDP
ncbi:MAG: hypothetical protein KDA20_11705, partial [Phycisphaerales bacterium]|nr:hypothetical protein [Phycisphaerales bacterium]